MKLLNMYVCTKSLANEICIYKHCNLLFSCPFVCDLEVAKVVQSLTLHHFHYALTYVIVNKHYNTIIYVSKHLCYNLLHTYIYSMEGLVNWSELTFLHDT